MAEGPEVLPLTEWAMGRQVDRVFQYPNFHSLCREAQAPRAGARDPDRMLGRVLWCTETFQMATPFQ